MAPSPLRLLGLAAVAGVAGLGYAAGIEVRAFTVRRVDVPVLPAGHRDIRVLHVSDLHLTPGQQAMWPAVEAALRNIAYARSGTAHRHGATAAQVASLDPDSTEVLGLKAAAIPLLMSFNDEQKSEVRNLAHVMGLDKLASDF